MKKSQKPVHFYDLKINNKNVDIPYFGIWPLKDRCNY